MTERATHDLDPDVLRALDLERDWTARHGTSPPAPVIRTTLGLSPARYRQLLHRALDHPSSVVYAPTTVPRLLRLREQRRRRTARALPLPRR